MGDRPPLPRSGHILVRRRRGGVTALRVPASESRRKSLRTEVGFAFWVRHLRWGILLTLALLPATYLLWLPGLQTTHDGFYHKSRLLELHWLLQAGVVYPRWLPHVSFFYGSPVLHFYAPFIYYVAEGFHLLGWGFLAAYEWMIGLGLVAAGWAMYHFARRWGRLAAWAAALVYAYWPYHMALAYVRGAQAELWALVWYPLILARLWPPDADRLRRERADPALALLFALLIVTHHLSAFAFAGVIALWVLWFAWRERNRAYLAWALRSLALGLALSAFYWLPVLADLRFVWASQPSDVERQELLNNLAPLSDMLSPFWVHRYVPFTGVRAASPMPRIGTAWTLVALALIAVRWRRLDPRTRDAVWLFTLVLVGGAFMLTQVSRPVWATVPLIHYLQFPWRLQSIIGLAAAGLVGIGVGTWAEGWRSGGWRTAARVALIGGVAVTMMVGALPGLRYDVAKEPVSGRPLRESDMDLRILPAYDYLRALSLREFKETWLFEYMPIWSTSSRMDFFLPPETPPAASRPLQVRVRPLAQHPLRRAFLVESDRPWTLSLHQFYFPAWEAQIDGQRAKTRPEGPLGLVAVDVPAGKHTVVLRYGATYAQRVAEVISLLGLMVWGVWTWRYRRRWLLILLLVGLYLAVATFPAWAQQKAEVHPQAQEVRFRDEILLAGSYVPRTRVRAGERVWFALYWVALKVPQERYKVIVHLARPDGQPIAIGDTEPGFFFTPTTRWQAGEIMEDWYTVVVPADTPPGRYLLLTGLYPLQNVRNIPPQGGTLLGDRVVVGEIEVEVP